MVIRNVRKLGVSKTGQGLNRYFCNMVPREVHEVQLTPLRPQTFFSFSQEAVS